MHAYTASCSPKPCTALTTLGLGCRDACLSSLSGSALWGLRLRLRAPETPLEPLGIGPRHAFHVDFGVRTVSDAQQSPRPGHTHHIHSYLCASTEWSTDPTLHMIIHPVHPFTPFTPSTLSSLSFPSGPPVPQPSRHPVANLHLAGGLTPPARPLLSPSRYPPALLAPPFGPFLGPALPCCSALASHTRPPTVATFPPLDFTYILPTPLHSPLSPLPSDSLIFLAVEFRC